MGETKFGQEAYDRNLFTWLIIDKLQNTSTLSISLKPHLSYHSFYMIIPGITPELEPEDLPVRFQVYLTIGDGRERLDDEIIKINRDTMILPLGDREIDQIDFVISPAETYQGTPILIKEMWAYPKMMVNRIRE